MPRLRQSKITLSNSVILALALSFIRLAGVIRAEDQNRIEGPPMRDLIRDATSVDVSRRSPSLSKLSDRLKSGKLSQSDVEEMIAAALEYQADLTKPWDFRWGELVETLHTTGQLTGTQWRRYAVQAFQGAFTLQTRSRVRRGDPLPYRVAGNGGRTSRDEPFGALVTEARFISTDPALSQSWNGPLPSAYSHNPFVIPRLVDAKLLSRATVGKHRVRLEGKFRVVLPNADAPPIAEGAFESSAEFDLIPADQTTVRIVHDPALTESITRSMQVKVRVGLTPMRGSPVDVAVDNPSVGLGFNVSLRSGQKTIPIGDFICPAGVKNFRWRMPAQEPLTIGSQVDVPFQNDPHAASAAAATIDQFEVWDGEVDFKSIVVAPFLTSRQNPLFWNPTTRPQ